MTRRSPFAFMTAVLLLAGLLGGAGPAQAAPSAAANAWTEIGHPRPGGADTYLHDVVVPAANDVWSVGYTFDVVGGAFEFRTYGQHCVSGVCTRANLPNREGAPATNFLYGIGAFSPTDMWTVGYSRNPGQIGVSMAIRYDGNTWQIVNTPNPAGSISNVLYAVADLGPANAIAVGTYQEGGTFQERPLAMSWDGAAWNLLSVPTVPGCSSVGILYDVAAVGSATFMAGKCRDTSGEDAGFVLSRSAGGAWKAQVRPGDGLLPSPSTLQSLSVVPGSGVWAVGSGGTGGLSIRFDNRGWQSAPVPQAGQYTDLRAVAGISRTEIWTVGATSQGVGPQRLSLNWNGRRWATVPAGESTSLAGVAYDPAGFWWAIGHNNSVSVMQRLDA